MKEFDIRVILTISSKRIDRIPYWRVGRRMKHWQHPQQPYKAFLALRFTLRRLFFHLKPLHSSTCNESQEPSCPAVWYLWCTSNDTVGRL